MSVLDSLPGPAAPFVGPSAGFAGSVAGFAGGGPTGGSHVAGSPAGVSVSPDAG